MVLSKEKWSYSFAEIAGKPGGKVEEEEGTRSRGFKISIYENIIT